MKQYIKLGVLVSEKLFTVVNKIIWIEAILQFNALFIKNIVYSNEVK